jgi:hypothetical protein
VEWFVEAKGVFVVDVFNSQYPCRRVTDQWQALAEIAVTAVNAAEQASAGYRRSTIKEARKYEMWRVCDQVLGKGE